jgi:hypothetical protein
VNEFNPYDPFARLGPDKTPECVTHVTAGGPVRRTPLCPECHHRPSGRTMEGQGHCCCKCHDIADASQALLAACKAALRLESSIAEEHWYSSRQCPDTFRAVRAAIAQAESVGGA